jgi:hypothetical protein
MTSPLLPPLDFPSGEQGSSIPRRRRQPALRGARVRWGKGGGGRGDLTDVHPGVEERRQGSRRRRVATAGGGLTRRRRSGGFPVAGSGRTGRARRVDASSDGGLHRGGL